MTFCYTCQITKTISAVSILPEFIVIFKINVVLVQCPIPYLSKFNHNHKKQMSGNTGRTGRSTHLCCEPSYTTTCSSLPGIKIQTNQSAGQRGLFMDSYFYLFVRLLSAFFLFNVKIQTKQD